ncbi:MAG: hypothetical protein KAR47_07975, partial [Planctomycetes bacterium]|nr:hypothetical protein [Planctomycetota bacterium]
MKNVLDKKVMKIFLVGGFCMMKKKKLLLTVISLLMGIAPMALAVEVISVDINNFTNDTVYAGEAAVPGATQWVAYYGDWGIPLGSPRSADLADTVTVQPSTYAEQVWLGDPGDHGYISGVGDGLLDDGFFNDGSGTSDP